MGTKSIDRDDSKRLMVFAGTSSKALGARIADRLGIELGDVQINRFQDGEVYVRFDESIRGADIFLVQSTSTPVNESLMELLIMINAAKLASAHRITAVMPYFGYAKGDKKDEPRVSIRARVCADAIEAAGADRVVTMDLHAAQIQGFFRVPVDDLYALPVLCDAVKEKRIEDLVVVSPDTRFAKQARKYASYLGTSLAIGDKERSDHDENAEIQEIIGDVEGKTALVVDDFTISGGTLVDIVNKLRERGARSILVAISHGIFSEGSMDKIGGSPIIKLIVTDSVETQPISFSDKVETVSVAPLFGEAIRRIHNRESISVLFPQ